MCRCWQPVTKYVRTCVYLDQAPLDQCCVIEAEVKAVGTNIRFAVVFGAP